MITNNEAEEILKKEYHIDNFTYIAEEILLPDYVPDKHEVQFNNSVFEKVTLLGSSQQCEISIYEVVLSEGVHNRRVTITQEMFRILRNQGVNNALVAFANADRRNYRISLLTSKYEFDGDKVVKVLSNPRRYSYSLGYGTKTKTAYDFLILKGKVNSLDELIERFSVEVVNKHFYNEIALAFTRLTGGVRDGKTYEKELNIYSEQNQNKYAEFAVRLIGRIVFCWFLKEKKSDANIPLIPENVLSVEAIENSHNYYHDILEPLFFELLNTPQDRRKDKFGKEEVFRQIPYLNGGLFSPHTDDRYKYSPATQTGQYGIVTIPNEWFNYFFGILNQYNFTVDENTSYDIELSIDPEMLGRIFENLLAEINPETGENAKKSTGSFYTPRDIVDYMVDNSVLEYLKSKTGIDEIRLKALISYSKEDDDLAVFNKYEKKALINALYSVTVLDPACGSGAFPIGMLQKIVYILQELDPGAELWFDKATENISILLKKEFEKKFNAGSLDYIRKLTVIQNSIFGIDIQPIAVEIARLRCFLSLVIEEKVLDDEPNRGINPLPNLDFKFIIADSLISLEADKHNQQLSMFESQSHIDALKRVRDEYFNVEADRKAELKEEFGDIQKQMLLATIDQFTKQPSKRYELLYKWSPFKNEPTSWFDPEWMFGIKDGFDIIIGNPPYIQLQKSINETSREKVGDKYQNCEFKTFARTGDIYCLFYEKGCQLLKTGGILTFITSNKWMRAAYGENLRKFLSQYNPMLLIDFAGQKVFESATVDVNILLVKKVPNTGSTTACVAKNDCRNNLSVYIQQNGFTNAFNIPQSWTILNPIEKSIKDKIESVGTPLKDWNISINYGIKTGCNEAFIINEQKKNELIAEDPKSAEIIRPILRGRDIGRYSYNFANLYLICTFPSKHYDIDDFPAVKNHLLSFGIERLEQTGKTHIINGEKVKARKKTTNKWFETQDNISYWDDFSKQKIIYPNMTKYLPFVYDEDAYVTNQKCFIITGTKLAYLTAFFNSSLFKYCYRDNFPELQGGTRELSKVFFDKIPVVDVDEKTNNLFKEIVIKIQSGRKEGVDTKKLEIMVDNMIFDIYGLSQQERSTIGFVEIQ